MCSTSTIEAIKQNSINRIDYVTEQDKLLRNANGTLSNADCIGLERYFVAIKERYNSGEKYPYNIEELVPTVFTEKGNAVRSLKKEFTQTIDFKSVINEDVRNTNGTPTIDYYLTPRCFEYLVAKKCRANGLWRKP